MSTITTFTGATESHSTAYSIQRLFLYWDVSGLIGKVKKATVKVYFRSSSTISNKSFHLCLFTQRIAQTNWSNYNSHTIYQYPSTSSSYYNEANYANFSNNYLVNQKVTNISVTGGAGNILNTLEVDVPSDTQDTSLWNRNVVLGFYETGGESSGLIWGTSQQAQLILETTNGVVSFGVDGIWQPCEMYYGVDGSWVQVQPYFGVDGEWKELGV